MFITPKKEYVYILGEKITIEIDDDKCDAENADGLYGGMTVYLRSQYPTREEYRRVYAHECFHALCELLGCQLDHHLEETLAHRVSHMIVYEL